MLEFQLSEVPVESERDPVAIVLSESALITQCLLHLTRAEDFGAASQVCKAWHACLLPENTPLWQGLIDKHLKDLPVWERATRKPGEWWEFWQELVPERLREMANWPTAEYKAACGPWTLCEPPLCCLMGDFDDIAYQPPTQVAPTDCPHPWSFRLVKDLIWLRWLGAHLIQSDAWKLLLLPGPHTYASPASSILSEQNGQNVEDTRFCSLQLTGDRAKLSSHVSYARSLLASSRQVPYACESGTVLDFIDTHRQLARYTHKDGVDPCWVFTNMDAGPGRYFATLPGFVAVLGASPTGNIVGIVGIDDEHEPEEYWDIL